MTIIVTTLLLALTTVIIHNECLIGIRNSLHNTVIQSHRWIVGTTVVFLLIAHVLEICLFGVGYYVMENHFHNGQIMGENSDGVIATLYFSFASYTTLGIGDLFPTGAIRLLAGFEGLLGLLMIGWSASFLYLEMRSLWTNQNQQGTID